LVFLEAMAMPCATLASGLQVSKLCLGGLPKSLCVSLGFDYFDSQDSETCCNGGMGRSISGTMTYGEQNTFEDACQQLNMAREEGVNFFDAAEM